MIVMYLFWKILKRTKFVRLEEMDLVSDRFDGGLSHEERTQVLEIARRSPFARGQSWKEKFGAIATYLFF